MARTPTEDRPNRIKDLSFATLKGWSKDSGLLGDTLRMATKMQLVVLKARDMTPLLDQQTKDLLTDISDVMWEIEKAYQNKQEQTNG